MYCGMQRIGIETTLPKHYVIAILTKVSYTTITVPQSVIYPVSSAGQLVGAQLLCWSAQDNVPSNTDKVAAL